MTYNQNVTPEKEPVPLFVGLNKTVVASDIVWELILQLLRNAPLLLFVLPLWLFRGKHYIEEKIAASGTIDPKVLPYRETTLAFLKDRATRKGMVVLTTHLNESTARMIAEHLGLFDHIIASNGKKRLEGPQKLNRIQALNQGNAFEFMGHDTRDLPVFEAASKRILVCPGSRLSAWAKERPDCTIAGNGHGQFRAVFMALRPHHWFKNLLLAIPLIMAHQWTDLTSLYNLGLALMAFCFIASAIYIYNDLLDLPCDRLHPEKKKRPIANGDLPIPVALILSAFLVSAGFILGSTALPGRFVELLVAYAVVALAYSAWFKQCLVLDVVVLTGLYTLRIFAGGAVAGVPVSAWLLAFSGFFFLSLAFAKRYLELALSDKGKNVQPGNRPYTVADLIIFRIAGPTSGLLSVLVLALYINSEAVQMLYRKPHLLWFLCPLILYWILRTWVLVLRGEAASDPVVFALKDKASLVVAALIMVVVLAAT